jgi:cytochrome c556
MRLSILTGALLLASIGATFADDDPIKARQDLMKANGNATKAVVPILKGQAPFDLATVQTALKAYIDAADKAPALFPAGSDTGKTKALPAIWQNKADFDARFAKLGADSKAALAAITDEANFKANFAPVLKDCGGCHETYRAKDQ